MVLEGAVPERVYRLAAQDPRKGALAPFIGADKLFAEGLTGPVLARRHAEGERFTTRRAAPTDVGPDVQFVVHAQGTLEPALLGRPPQAGDGDVLVLLGR